MPTFIYFAVGTAVVSHKVIATKQSVHSSDKGKVNCSYTHMRIHTFLLIADFLCSTSAPSKAAVALWMLHARSMQEAQQQE